MKKNYSDPGFPFKLTLFVMLVASPFLIYQKSILKSFPLIETIATSLKFTAFCIRS